MKFKNETRKLKMEDLRAWDQGPNRYLYDKPSNYLFVWSRMLQAIISQTLSKLYSGEFHKHECGIYKCEGGCRVDGMGDLVLQDTYCYYDYSISESEKEGEAAELITKLVTEWDPMDPIKSMIRSAAEFLDMDPEEFKEGTKESTCGGVFGGDSLSAFFGWNPFMESPVSKIRDYQRWCLVNFDGMSEEEVDQMYADQDLGKELLDAMKEKCREAANDKYVSLPMCCSPNRGDNGLGFWINTGRSTQIDGWKTEEEIREFLEGDGILVDTAKW